MTKLTIGILGAGQLARMLALAAHPMAIDTLCLSPERGCAADVTNIMLGDYESAPCVDAFLQHVDVVTLENENIPEQTLARIEQHKPLYPPRHIVQQSQDRWLEKQLFQRLAIPTPSYQSVDSLADLQQALNALGYPAVLKTRRFGYDGKGQCLIKTPQDAESAWETLAGQALILEQFIAFDREVSLIAVADTSGQSRYYPLTENIHQNGILQQSNAPYDNPTLQQQAQDYAKKIMDAYHYVGVLAIEFFQRGQQLIANELAPRVHNSGHWTIEGAQTSQFANHIRAVASLPLGSPQAKGAYTMYNYIGQIPDPKTALTQPHAHYHNYGKAAKPGRKLGHLTIVGGTTACQ